MSRPDGKEETIYIVGTALVTVLCMTLVWTVRYPPLVDYPNHLARCYILFHLHDVPEYQELYIARWVPVPNLAMDVILYLLQHLLNVEIAGKVVLSLVVLLFAMGAVMLSRALWGQVTWVTPLVASFAFSSAFLYGFVNYCLGIGLYLYLLALWLRTNDRGSILGIFVTSLSGMLCYLTHLTAFACFGISVILYLVLIKRCPRRALVHALALLGVFLLFSLWGSDKNYRAPILWNTVAGKISVLLPMVRTYSWRFDIVYLLVMIAGVVVLLRVNRPLRFNAYALNLAACFILLYLFLPKEIAAGSAVDARFVLPAVVMLLISTSPVGGSNVLVRRLSLVVIYVFMFLRLGYIGFVWVKIDADARNYARTFLSLPQGSWVYPIVVLPDEIDANKRERFFVHFIHYSTIWRRTFSPTIFTIPGQQPLRRRVFEPYREAAETEPHNISWQGVLSKYDYLWCYGLPHRALAKFGNMLRLVSEVGKVTVYEVRRRTTWQPPPHPSPGAKATGDSPTRGGPPVRRR